MTPSPTITFFAFGPGFGLPEVSPFCTKTEVQLKMAGLPYRKEMAKPEDSPKGQLPYIDDNGERIADSHFIRAYIERKYGFDLDDGLDAAQRAQAWAVERMLENHFNSASGYARWIVRENFDIGPAHFFDDVPEPMREKVREEVRGRVANRLFEVGIARHTPDEIVDLGDRSLAALSVLARRQALSDGRTPERCRRDDVRGAGRHSDAVFRVIPAAPGRELPKPRRLHRAVDAAILSRTRLAGRLGGVGNSPSFRGARESGRTRNPGAVTHGGNYALSFFFFFFCSM